MGKDKNLSESLRYIYEHLGVKTFQNEKVMYSVLMDLIPKEKMKINWVIDAINSGAVKPLIEAELNNLNREEQKIKARSILEANEINKSRIEYLLNCFSYGLKWTDKMISIEEIKAQEEKANSKKNTPKETIKKQTTRKKESRNTNKDTSNIKNNQNQRKTPTITKDKLQKLEYDLESLYTKIDNILQFYRNSVYQIKTPNLFLGFFVNIFIIIGCITLMASYVFVLKEGYAYKRILALDMVGVVLGIRLLKANFRNLKALKAQGRKKRLYKKYIDLKGAVDFNLRNVQSGAIMTLQGYRDTQTLIKDYENKFNDLQIKLKDIQPIYKEENKTIAKWVVLFMGIFIVSGVFEPRLVYDHDSMYHVFSRSIVETISDKVYDKKYACIQADLANVRREPTKDSESIKIIEKYETVRLTGKSYTTSEDKTWYEVDFYSEKGWISSSVISVVPYKVVVTSDAANVRERANLNSDIATVVSRGEILYPTGRAIEKSERTWYEIYLDGDDGYWISSNVVEEAN